MLKDKSCYANENAYTRAFFLHKGLVQDYLVDPMAGSFIRVIHPHPEQPKCEKGWYTRPQFMFMNRKQSSRMYDLTDLEQLGIGVERILDTVGRTGTFSFGATGTRDAVTVDDTGLIMFKTGDGSYGTLVMRISPAAYKEHLNHEHLSIDRYIRIVTNLLNGLKLARQGVSPEEDIMVLPSEMMTTLHRWDAGVRTPIVISGRKHKDRKENYIMLRSGDQHMLFPSSDKISAVDMINDFMGTIGVNCELLQDKPAGEGIVSAIMSKTGEFSSNMEYVNCRMQPYESGDKIHVIMNSDRFPANTKFSYIYERAFHAKFQNLLAKFAKQFAEMEA